MPSLATQNPSLLDMTHNTVLQLLGYSLRDSHLQIIQCNNEHACQTRRTTIREQMKSIFLVELEQESLFRPSPINVANHQRERDDDDDERRANCLQPRADEKKIQ